MADNVEITSGVGTFVATDDCGGAGHVQVLKLAISADGSATYIPADATNGLRVNLSPKTSGGQSIFRSLDLDETEEAVKASAGQVYGWYMSNSATSARFVKFYNDTTANVTVGSSTPVMTVVLPASSAANVAFPHGIAFSTAITIAATTGVADADTGAPAANDVVANILYT